MTEAPTLKAIAVVCFSYGIMFGVILSEVRRVIIEHHHSAYGPGFSERRLQRTLLR